MESAISDRRNPHQDLPRPANYWVAPIKRQDSNSRAFDQEKVKGATGPVKYADAKRATCDKAFWVNRYMVDPDGPENNLKNWIKASLPSTYKYVGQVKRAGKSASQTSTNTLAR